LVTWPPVLSLNPKILGSIPKQLKKANKIIFIFIIFARNFQNFSGFRSTENSLETSYGFDIPKFQSQKIPESTPEVLVGQKFFFAKRITLVFNNNGVNICQPAKGRNHGFPDSSHFFCDSLCNFM
jgi:hypothetical protein